MKKHVLKRVFLFLSALLLLLTVTACSTPKDSQLILSDAEEERVVNLFSPMEKINPDAQNVARTASELTIALAEEKVGTTMAYRTYTAADYQDKTYDDVTLERARNNMDDMYLLNPDVISALGKEGLLADLSDMECVDNLRDVIITANTVDGKLVAIPQEVVAYGLFINTDIFEKCHLEIPNTPEEFLACCQVLQDKGYETPVGANRWWLETFVFAQAYADLYNGGDTEAEIAALNSGEKKYSDYMRPSFEFLQELIDRGFIDAEKAVVSEAIEGEGSDFLAGKTPIVMAYWGAANTETAYGKTDFSMQVIGFPSSRGQMPVMTITGFGIGVEAEHREDAIATLNAMLTDEALQLYSEMNQVISPSKNVEVDCVDSLKPLNALIQENVYVLASNANMKLEQWGNVCLLVRDLLEGATVEECMEKLDRLQAEAT